MKENRRVTLDFSEPARLRNEQLELTQQYAKSNQQTLISCYPIEKRPIEKEWQNSSPAIPSVIRKARNEGYNTGSLNDQGNIDIDIDDPAALIFAHYFLPPTSTYGRYSKPSSHWRYETDGGAAHGRVNSSTGHIELRTGRSQSLMPGSIHPSGELYCWEDDRPPAYVSFQRLQKCVRLMAAATILQRSWIRHERDDLATAVCGVMLRAHYSIKDVDKLIKAVCKVCGDEETPQRLKARRLKKTLREEGRVPGIPALKELLGEEAEALLSCLEIASTSEGSLSLVRADEIEPMPIDWLWSGRFAFGKFSIIAGDPGTSKSTLTLDLGARITVGEVFPDGATCKSPGSVILIAGEDDPADTIVPRFLAAGGDAKKLHIRIEEFTIQQNYLQQLEQAIREIGDVRLLVIDPITEFLGKVGNAADMTEMRRVLAPLIDLLRRHKIACIAVSHLNKDQTQAAIYRTTGSLAFVAVARAVFLIGKDKECPERRLMLPVKNNLGPDTLGLAYAIRETKVGDVTTTTVLWEPDPVEVTPDEILGDSSRSAGTTSPKLDEAMSWLSDYLESGPKLSEKIRGACGAQGHSWATVKRAKNRLGVVTMKRGAPGERGHWEWRLP